MRHRLVALTLASAALSVVIACGEEAPTPPAVTEGPRTHGLTEAQANEALVVVGDRTITVGEFAEAIASKGPFLRTRYNAPERRRELLDQMVRFELLAQEARRQGLDRLPEVERTRQQVLIRRFLKREFEDTSSPNDVSDADVQAFYEAHRSEFEKPEQVRASQIVVRDAPTAQRLLRQVLASSGDPRLFRDLAERYNQDPGSRDRFGDLGFFSRPAERQEGEPAVPPEVADAAFGLNTIGAVHPTVVRTSAGFHIVKLTGRRAPLHRSLEEASRSIRHRLWRERREAAVEALVTRLRQESDVEEHLEVLEQLHLDLPETAPRAEAPEAPAPATTEAP